MRIDPDLRSGKWLELLGWVATPVIHGLPRGEPAARARRPRCTTLGAVLQADACGERWARVAVSFRVAVSWMRARPAPRPAPILGAGGAILGFSWNCTVAT